MAAPPPHRPAAPRRAGASKAALPECLQRDFVRRPDRHDHQVLYAAVQAGIRHGELAAGLRLPPSRALAQGLGIARNTVVHVYAQLALEGYLQARVGRGTFVAATLPRQVARGSASGAARGSGRTGGPVDTTRSALLSRRGARLLERASAGSRQWGAFAPGVPEVRLFPAVQWSRVQARLWRHVTPPQLSYAVGGGDAGLRYAIAEHLVGTRGVRCTPEQVVVTSGTQQSLHLVGQLLADRGDAVWLEDPGYWGARSVFGAQGLKLVPVPVDAEGLAPTPAQRRDAPRAMFVSPSHQYPLGHLMSAARRSDLLAYAANRGVWIIEDDYDSEFRHAGRPLPALQGQDRDDRVVYLGTFSKTLFPALRLAYLVLPPGLVPAFGRALNELYREGQTPQQAVLARFMSEGHYASHVRRMRGIYRARHDALVEQIARHFGPEWPVWGGGGGLHLVLGLPKSADDADIAQRVQQAGVACRPLSLYHLRRPAAQSGLVLGYGAVDEADIARHFATLAQVVQGPPKRTRR